MYREIPARDSPSVSPLHEIYMHPSNPHRGDPRASQHPTAWTPSNSSNSSAFNKPRHSNRDHKYKRVQTDFQNFQDDEELDGPRILEGDYVDIRRNGGRTSGAHNGNCHPSKLKQDNGGIYEAVSNGIGEMGKNRVSRYYDDDDDDDVDNYIQQYKGLSGTERVNSRRGKETKPYHSNNNIYSIEKSFENEEDRSLFINTRVSEDSKQNIASPVRNGDVHRSNRRESDEMDVETKRKERVSQSRSASTESDSTQNFLGSGTQSAWLKWSHERRASYRRKVEFIEQRQNELEKIKISSPVRKARKESVRFVAPELEERHLTVDSDLDAAAAGLTGPAEQGGLLDGQAAFPFEIPMSSRRKSVGYDWSGTGVPMRCHDGRMTLAQWNTLMTFWENKTFVRSRYIGVVLSLIAILINVLGLSLDTWSVYECEEEIGTLKLSLWRICDIPHHNCTSLEHDKWEISVISVLMFSVLFGSAAVALSVCGIFTASLPKRIYYHHSAGEIYLICALGCSATLILHPLTLRLDEAAQRLLSEHLWAGLESCRRSYLGPGYFVTASAATLYSLASLCLCLDDIIRSAADGFGLARFCRRRNADESSKNRGQGRILRLFGEDR